MDHQTILKSILEERYDILWEETILPSRLCYRNLKHDYQFSDLDQQEFRYVEYSCLHPFTTVPLTEILSCDCKHKSSQKTILTLGVCGVGKSTTVRSCALEWAEGTGYQNIHLMFPFTFWELSMLKKRDAVDPTSTVTFPRSEKYWRFQSKSKGCVVCLWWTGWVWSPATIWHSTSEGCLWSSHCWCTHNQLDQGDFTSQCSHLDNKRVIAAAGQIPGEYLLKETQVQGFSDEQKMEKFHSTLNDNDMANRAIDHVKSHGVWPPFVWYLEYASSWHLFLTVIYVPKRRNFKISPLSLTRFT